MNWLFIFLTGALVTIAVLLVGVVLLEVSGGLLRAWYGWRHRP